MDVLDEGDRARPGIDGGLRREQKALHVEAVALPAQVAGLAGGRLQCGVALRDRLPRPQRAHRHLGRLGEAVADRGAGAAVGCERSADAAAGTGDAFASAPEDPGRSALADFHERAVALDLRAGHEPGREPAQGRRGGAHPRREIPRLRAAVRGQDEDVAAARALVAHQAFDEGDARAVRAPDRLADLRLVRLLRVGEKGEEESVGAESKPVLVVRFARLAGGDAHRRSLRELLHLDERLVGQRSIRRWDLLDPRHAGAVARKHDAVQPDGLVEHLQHRRGRRGGNEQHSD